MYSKPAGSTSPVTSSSSVWEASSSQAEAAQPQPARRDDQYNRRASMFDGLSDLPSELRAKIVQPLGPDSLASLSSTSRQMAQDTADRLQTLLRTRPRYDPALDFGSITTAQDVRASLRAVENFPYPADENRTNQVVRSVGEIVQRLPALPRQQRFEAFTAVLGCIARIQNPPALVPLSMLMVQVGSLPEERREEAFNAVCPQLMAARNQARHTGAPPVMETVAQAISQLPQPAVSRALAGLREGLSVSEVQALVQTLMRLQ